jgi:hypothetical protein
LITKKDYIRLAYPLASIYLKEKKYMRESEREETHKTEKQKKQKANYPKQKKD